LADHRKPAVPTQISSTDIPGQCIADPILKHLRFCAPPHWQHALLSTCATFPLGAMYQIVFNEISAAEMAKIPKKLQLELLAEFQFLPDNLDHLDSKAFGVIEREGKKLYRYRASDYRIYFARTADGILVHRVLHKNTIGDFLFRSKLPLAEDEQLEQSSGFWKLIEEGERTKNER
jgi:mRNA-degrading endonuclease RelE of RelBE toxin-antitoxin system